MHENENRIKKKIKQTYFRHSAVGIITGNPWVIQRNPHPTQQKTVPATVGAVFWRVGGLWLGTPKNGRSRSMLSHDPPARPELADFLK